MDLFVRKDKSHILHKNKKIIKFNSINEIMENKLHTVNSFSNGGAMATTSLLYEKNQKKF